MKAYKFIFSLILLSVVSHVVLSNEKNIPKYLQKEYYPEFPKDVDPEMFMEKARDIWIDSIMIRQKLENILKESPNIKDNKLFNKYSYNNQYLYKEIIDGKDIKWNFSICDDCKTITKISKYISGKELNEWHFHKNGFLYWANQSYNGNLYGYIYKFYENGMLNSIDDINNMPTVKNLFVWNSDGALNKNEMGKIKEARSIYSEEFIETYRKTKIEEAKNIKRYERLTDKGKMCYQNLLLIDRTIRGWNRDINKDNKKIIVEDVEKHFGDKMPKCPEGGKYKINGNNIPYCTKHGEYFNCLPNYWK